MDNTFVKIIKYLRLSGMSDAEIARQAGCHAATVPRIHDGQMPRYTLGVALKDLYEKRQTEYAQAIEEINKM